MTFIAWNIYEAKGLDIHKSSAQHLYNQVILIIRQNASLFHPSLYVACGS